MIKIKQKPEVLKSIVLTITVIFIFFSLMSCETNDIYNLVKKITDNSEEISFDFDIEARIEIDKSYLIKNQVISEVLFETESIPSEILLKFTGTVESRKNFHINLQINNDPVLSSDIYRKDDKIYVGLNDIACVSTSLIRALCIADINAVRLFEDELLININAGKKYLCFDAENFQTDYLEQYFNVAEKILSVVPIKSEYEYTQKARDNIQFPVFSEESITYYDDVVLVTQKKLMQLEEYRYKTLHILLSNDDEKTFLDIAGVKKDGTVSIFDTREVSISIKELKRDNTDNNIINNSENTDDSIDNNDGIANNHSEVLSFDMIPFRYIFETLGYEVGYNEERKQAYLFTDSGDKIYVVGTIKNGRTHVSLIQLIIIGVTDVEIVDIGEYIEVKLNRQ